MSEHTKEPWSIGGITSTDVDAAHGGFMTTIADCINHGSIGRNNAEANARRIVAAVNACAGIDIEYLESPDNLATHARKMLLQRDELLAALKGAEIALKNSAPIMKHYSETLTRHEEALTSISKAIAEVEASK